MRSLPVAALAVAVLTVTALGALATPALAHAGIGLVASFAIGFLHPMTGVDHMLTMIAVGTMAAVVGGRAMWSVPCAFLAMMMLGAAAGSLGLPVPMVELGIGASVVVLGLATTFGRSIPEAAAVALAAGFAVFHGHAHGTEMAPSLSAAEYGAGFVLATALLHGCGLFGARLLCQRFATMGANAVHLTGITIAAFGAGMVGTML
ncbi:HupE/UreJ family protein [Thalassobaculum litoreum]|uniref:Urease accessory protein n=1 Tax=Thalassobaculum litoreum DSM 18839 TaxID=1123362 RepID=A0A8G2EY45_9PROT|nr:HupE/UreJ family protein [Thalassobaculum litoreum]SDG43679.1 urease accessory protein [Thalassobaculum litoreum DSM 18839]